VSKMYSMVKNVFGVVEALPPGVEAAADPGLEYGDSSFGCSKSRRLDIVRPPASSLGCRKTPPPNPDCLVPGCEDTQQFWLLLVFVFCKQRMGRKRACGSFGRELDSVVVLLGDSPDTLSEVETGRALQAENEDGRLLNGCAAKEGLIFQDEN